jgi:hypothetical protein
VAGSADAGLRLRARVVATDRGGSTTAFSPLSDVVTAAAGSRPPAPAARGPRGPNGRGADLHATVQAWLEDAQGHRATKMTLRPGTRVRIRGLALDVNGHPIAAAALGVVETIGGRLHPTTGVRTLADGRFTTFARIAPTRSLRFTYRPFRSSTRVIRSPSLRIVVRR